MIRQQRGQIQSGASHTRTGLLLFVLLTATVAGCLGGDDEVDEEPANPGNTNRGYEDLEMKPAESNALETEFNAIQIVAANDPDWDRPNLTKDDWLLLSTPMSEQGSVVAFEWEYPKEAVVSNPNTGGDVVAMDFAITTGPMGESGRLSEGIDWMFMVFYERNDETEGWETALGGFEWSATVEDTEWALTGEAETSSTTASGNPFLIRASAAADTGDKFILVLAARGPAGSPFGVGVRMLPQQQAGRDDSPTADWKEFAVQVEARDVPPFVPERVSEKEGLLLAMHHEERRQGQTDRVRRTLDMEPPEDTLPTEPGALAYPRSSVFSTQTDWGGWSNVDIRYENSPSTNQWTASGSIHGHEANRDVLLTSQTPRVCLAMVEGSDSAQIENTIHNGATATAETIRYEHFSANVQLEPITGKPLRSNWNC